MWSSPGCSPAALDSGAVFPPTRLYLGYSMARRDLLSGSEGSVGSDDFSLLAISISIVVRCEYRLTFAYEVFVNLAKLIYVSMA